MLTDEQLTELRVLVGPGAWAAHEALPSGQQADTAVAFTVLGDLRLVAAEVLEAVAAQAGAGGSASKVKVGPLELSLLPDEGLTSWLARAARYRALATGSGVPGAEWSAWTEPC